jgi:hypothetical protein
MYAIKPSSKTDEDIFVTGKLHVNNPWRYSSDESSLLDTSLHIENFTSLHFYLIS